MVSENIGNISGQIAGVSLPSFMQMIEMEQKTCTVKVYTKKNVGSIFFLNGTLIDSNTVNLERIDALYDILSWSNILIEVEKNESKKQDNINLPLMHVLMESALYSDEKKELEDTDDNMENKEVLKKNILLKTLKNKDFCLEIGINLLIDFDDREISLHSRLIGMEYGQYLLLKIPEPFGQVDHEILKVKDMVIKSLYKGTIYAFRSKLINIISNPSNIMFIEYPKKIEHHELRAHKRFKCSIVTQTNINKKERGGVIENISKGGCLCKIEQIPAEKYLSDQILNHTISFRCHFPGSKGETNFKGKIKNIKKKQDEISVGIKFVLPENSKGAKDIIDDYIRVIEYSSQDV